MVVIKNNANNMYLVGTSEVCKGELKFSTEIDDSLSFTKVDYAQCYIVCLENFIGRKLDLSIINN